MNIIGKGDVSLRKLDVIEGSKNTLSFGYKKIAFAHQANLNDTQINLSSLNFPSSLANTLVSNPSARTLAQCNLRYFYKNMLLFSTSRGILIPDISFTATNNSILLRNIQALQNEIFYGIIDYASSPNTLFVDARPINVSRAMGSTGTTFNVGESYQVNAFQDDSSGAVKVFINGVLKFRNTNNSSTVKDRDYYEVPSSDGYGTTIEFNTAPGASAQITVISNYAYVDRPDNHIMQKLDVLATQLQSVATQGNFSLNVSQFPNVMDLKAFGDRVLAYETRATSAETRLTSAETRLTAAEVKNRVTRHQMTTSVTNATSNDIVSLRFRNLTIGKVYRLVIQITGIVAANTTVSLTATNNAVTVGIASATMGTSTGTFRVSTENIFTAAATSVLFNAVATGVGCTLQGGSTASDTFAVLEELNDTTLGTAFD